MSIPAAEELADRHNTLLCKMGERGVLINSLLISTFAGMVRLRLTEAEGVIFANMLVETIHEAHRFADEYMESR